VSSGAKVALPHTCDPPTHRWEAIPGSMASYEGARGVPIAAATTPQISPQRCSSQLCPLPPLPMHYLKSDSSMWQCAENYFCDSVFITVLIIFVTFVFLFFVSYILHMPCYKDDFVLSKNKMPTLGRLFPRDALETPCPGCREGRSDPNNDLPLLPLFVPHMCR